MSHRILRALTPPALRGYRPAWLRADLFAGIALAAVAIPEAMGYSSIAQVPVSAGLYAMIVPTIAFALIGSSKMMVVGADSATAALLASGIAGLSIAGLAPFTADWLGWAGLIAVATGLMLLIARLLRLGFLGDFLSPAVQVGFLAGVGFLVLTEQLPGMLGISHTEAENPNVLVKWWHVLTSLGEINWWSLGFALATLVAIVGVRLSPRKLPVPVPIVMVIVSIAVCWACGWDRRVGVVGDFGGKLPTVSLPTDQLLARLPLVMTIAFGCMLVILAQSAATARSFAQQSGDVVDVNRDILGLSAANLTAGFTGAFVVNGSPTKTAIVKQEHGRTQVTNLVMAAVVLIATVALNVPLAHLPKAVIAAIVFVVGIDLIDVTAFGRIWWIRRIEFVIAVVTAVTVIWFGVLTGIISAMVLSLLQIIHRQYRPERFVVGVGKGGRRVYESARPGHQTMPGLIVFRYDADLFYANIGRFSDSVMRLVKGAPDPVRWLVLDCSAISDVDYSAAHELKHLIDFLHGLHAKLILAGVTPELTESLRTARLIEDFEPHRLYPTVGDAIRAYRKEYGYKKDGTRKKHAGVDVVARRTHHRQPVSVGGNEGPGVVVADDVHPEGKERDRHHLEARDAQRDADDGQAQREPGGDVADGQPDTGDDHPDHVADQ